MKQYCRYCANAICGDSIGIYCEAKHKEYSASTAKTENKCKDFIYNEIDVFYCGETDKKYTPREPKMKQCEGQIDLFNTVDNEDAEYQAYWDSKGKCLGYINEACPNCGRIRIEKYSNGEKICEKCNWNSTLQKYEDRGI